MNRRAGLIGVGTYLPPQKRPNSWWPKATVGRWQQIRRVLPPLADGEPTPAMARVIAAMADQAFDPFQGVTERRVLPSDMSAADMEVQASERAIENARIDRREIDLL